MIEYSDLVASYLVFSACTFSTGVVMLLGRQIFVKQSIWSKMLAVVFASAFAGVVTWRMLHPGWILAIPLLLGLVSPLIARRILKGLLFTGSFLMAAHANLSLAGLLWGLSILVLAHLGPTSLILISAAYALTVVSIVVGLIQSFEQWEVVCRSDWSRPRSPEAVSPRNHFPKVSLHVPACSEPADLVIATLDSLSRLQYPNFEVLVIDNNTPDPALWRPVEAHCKQLGERFRFFHVDRLPGAKAGALNYALRHTSDDSELIGVIDSDYQVAPDFLSALVGHFDDPEMGFVQSPQAYRDWQSHTYLTMCNWEYKLVFATTLVSRNERMAAITVGTMGLIRHKVLKEVGGWSEWCLTEDSELAVRIHAKGHRSLYLNAVYGQGLIPESFQEYKKQRFRWTYGPIQELRRHFRLFLPKPFAEPSALTPAQKLHHAIHGLGALKSGLELLLLPLGAIAMLSMLVHGESIHVPSYIWSTLAVSGVAAFVLKWHLFRATMGCSLGDMLGALMATTSLDYTIRMASLSGLFTRNSPWQRTNKFKVLPLGPGVLGSVLPELLLGGTMLVAAFAVLVTSYMPGLLRLVAAGCGLQGGIFLAAPMLAILAELGISKRARSMGEETVDTAERLPQLNDT